MWCCGCGLQLLQPILQVAAGVDQLVEEQQHGGEQDDADAGEHQQRGVVTMALGADLVAVGVQGLTQLDRRAAAVVVDVGDALHQGFFHIPHVTRRPVRGVVVARVAGWRWRPAQGLGGVGRPGTPRRFAVQKAGDLGFVVLRTIGGVWVRGMGHACVIRRPGG